MKILQAVVFVASFLSIVGAPVDESSEVIVHISNGVLKGEKLTGETGNVFYSFKKIPFAEPPVGNLRFRPPVPKRPWNSVLDATKDGPSCPQINYFTSNYEGEEDCLYLNVYTPKLPGKDNKKMDVVYHIHGGGFQSMAGHSLYYGPKRFPYDDIVLVSLTYRVGALGFLSTNDSASYGNYGLLDQVEGLRWVRNNIHHFGGDPNKVTILGESAGGASVIYQMLSPLTEGLFHRAVAMSGSALCQWAFQKDPAYWSKKLGKELDCPTESSEQLVECLREIPYQALTEKASQNMSGRPYLSFTPTLDHYFIEDSPLKIVKEKKQHKDVPLIIGTTKDEGNCWFLGRKDSPNDYTDEEILDVLKECVDYLPDVDEKVKLIKEMYFPNLTSYKEADIQPQLSLAITHGMFHKCIFRTAKEMTESGTKTYLYRYDYEAPFISQILNTSATYGVCHADDLFMFFDGLFDVPSFDEPSQRMKDKFQKLITNFVKYGDPVPSDEQIADCEWPQSEVGGLFLKHIDLNCSVETYDETKDPLYNFWINEINHIEL